MSSRRRATVDDRPSGTPEDGLSSVGSTVSPAERHSSEPPPLAPVQQENSFVAPVDAALRVGAFIVAAGIVGLGAWWLFADWVAGAPMSASSIWFFLFWVAFSFPVIRELWLVASQGFDRGPDAAETESRAFLEAVDRHDRLLEAQRLAAEKADGDLNGEPADRGSEAKIGARMKERGDPG
ncbi:MAG: hypothetical protein ACJ8GN_24480 [Longimicrobiaceae bacterium]